MLKWRDTESILSNGMISIDHGNGIEKKEAIEWHQLKR